MRSHRRRFAALSLAVSAGLLVAACGSDDGGSDDTPAAEDDIVVPVSLQLQWSAQAQFAGYYAALGEGYFTDEGLDVEIVEGGVDIVPQLQLATGAADYAIAWVPKALESREQDANITNVAQMFQRSATTHVAWADSGIETIEDLEGKKIGSWMFGNEYEPAAALKQAGLPYEGDAFIQQDFDMQALLTRQLDAAQAMTYNEYAMLLETVNPDTGELYQPDDFNVIDYNEVGTAMLQDAIWADTARLAEDEEYQETTQKLIKASIKGWVFCRDNPEECVEYVLEAGPALGTSHQQWMLAEASKLVWPSPNGAGVLDEAMWDQTVQISTDLGLLSAEPDPEAYTTEYAEAAVSELEEEGVDVIGENFEPEPVELTEGGQ